MRLQLLLAACALAVSSPAFAQTAIAGSDSSADSSAEAGASAGANSGGNQLATDVAVTFEAPEERRTTTLRMAPDVNLSAPFATASCFRPRGLSVSVIGGAGGYAGGNIDQHCQHVEDVRVLGGTFANNPDPIAGRAVVRMARNTIPEFNDAYQQELAEAQASQGAGTVLAQAAPDQLRQREGPQQ